MTHRLNEAHRRHLTETSGLTEETVALARLYSTDDPKHVAELLQKRWRSGGGLVFPYFDLSGEHVFSRVRPDKPKKKSDGSVGKYEQPFKIPTFPYLPPRSVNEGRYASAETDLLFVEGEKKALCLDQLGYAVVGASGVWNFHDVAYRHEEERFRLHPVLIDNLIVRGRRCIVCFDSDAASKDGVMLAAKTLAGMLNELNAGEVLLAKIPEYPDDSRRGRGIDDLFVEMGEKALRRVITDSVEIKPGSLEDPSQKLRELRPLSDAPIDPNLRLPVGYRIDRFGGLLKLPEDEAGKVKQVERDVILIKRVLEDLDTHELRVELAFRGPVGWRTTIVDRQAIADSRAALASFAPLGLPINSRSAGDVVEWLTALEYKNRRRMPRTTCTTRCGWRRLDGRAVFALEEPVDSDHKKPEVLFDGRSGRERLVHPIHTAGSPEAHLDVLRRAFAADRVAATAIMGALAAPLLRCVSAPNFAIHLAGDSSRGKS